MIDRLRRLTGTRPATDVPSATTGDVPALEVRNLDFSYGKLQVLFDVSVEVADGEIVALLGTNGAGKSTLLRAVCGLDFPTRGTVRCFGEDITTLDAEKRVARGVVQVPGGKATFPSLTVLENLQTGGYLYRRDRARLAAAVDEVFDYFPVLAERRDQAAGTLSGGEQQMVALGRAFIAGPRLLLIDELSLGLAPVIVEQLLGIVRGFAARGTTLVLVEQSVNVALSVADHAYFMERGQVRFGGPTRELLERGDLLRSVFLEGAEQSLADLETPRMMELVFTLHWPFHFEAPMVAIVLGLVVGLSYALLAMGMILIYRSTRVINLAHGEVGAFAAAIVAVLVNERGWPYWVAGLLALIVAGLLGAAVELLIIRRLFRAPRLIVLVATMGVAQLFLFGTFLVNSSINNRLAGFPAPFSTRLTLGALVLQPGELLLLIMVPLVAAALAAFFSLTGFGVAVRASAENADAARLVGIPTRRISTFVWVVAAVLSAVTALMLAPGRGLTVTESLGPDLLMRALAAAVLARMTSLPRALGAGIIIGVVEKTVAWNYSVGEVELVLFALVMGALLFQHRGAVRSTDASAWQMSTVVRPVPRAVQALPAVRALSWIGLGVFVLAAAIAPFVLSNSQTFLLTTVVAFAIVALSVTILTGYSGQISLGQVAFFGIGAAVSYQLTVELYVPFWIALFLAGFAGAAAAVLIGIPALRIRGLFLAVTTLAFALVTQKWLLGKNWMAGAGVISPRPYWGRLDFASQQAYFYLAIGGLLVAILICRNTLRSGIGRNLQAIRDNEAQGAAFTVPVVRTKLTAFAISGFLAAFGGAIYGHGVETFQVANFPVSDSLRVVSMTIIGGLGSIPGTILGAFFVVGVDRLVEVQYLRLLSTSIGLLLLLLYLPGGFGQIIYAGRDRLVRIIARRAGITLEDSSPAETDGDVEDSMPADISVAAAVAKS